MYLCSGQPRCLTLGGFFARLFPSCFFLSAGGGVFGERKEPRGESSSRGDDARWGESHARGTPSGGVVCITLLFPSPRSTLFLFMCPLRSSRPLPFRSCDTTQDVTCTNTDLRKHVLTSCIYPLLNRPMSTRGYTPHDPYAKRQDLQALLEEARQASLSASCDAQRDLSAVGRRAGLCGQR